MAMILARNTFVKTSASVFRLIGVSGPSIRPASHGEHGSHGKIPDIYDKDALPDPIENAAGLEKKQLLALMQGDMRYEPKMFKLGPGTKDKPNIIMSHQEGRLVGCVCEPDQQYVNYWAINLDELKRCECGYWFKCVKSDPEFF